MKNIYQIFIKYKLLLSAISIVNIIFLKLWIFSNAFNIYNFFSTAGIDYRITIYNLILFIISSFLVFCILKLLIVKNYSLSKNLLYFTLIILAFNSIRASISINLLTLNTNLKILILFFLLIIIFVIIIRYAKYFLENFFYFIGLTFFPFFIIVLFKLLFQVIFIESYNKNNFYNEITSVNQINEKNIELTNKKVIWLIFDQYDFKIIKENINHLNNYKFLSEVSDNYINYSPNTVETLKTIPSLILSKDFDDYEYEIDKGKITLNALNKSLNLRMKFSENNSIFEYFYKKNYNIYINGWYIPYCSIFKNLIYKCFQSFYAYETTFDYYGFKNYFYFQLYNILPGADYFINKFKLKKLYDITHSGSLFEVAKKNYLASKKSFFFNLKDKNINLYFLHSNIPHPPFIFDASKNKLVEFVDRNKSNYINNLILTDMFLGKIIFELKNLDIFDETIIILQGDTGHEKKNKGLSSEEMISPTPLLIKKRNQQKKNIINEIISPYELSNRLKILINN